MSGKYFIFSISRPGATPSLNVVMAVMLIAFGFLLSSSNGIPVPDESLTSSTTTTQASTTVKILIPPSSEDEVSEDDDDDAVIIEAGNSTNPPFPREPFHPRDCFMEKEKGPCRAIIDMWFFNQETRTCEQFQYSGCGGNGNRFSEKSECDRYCAGGAKKDQDESDDTDAIVIDPGTDDEDSSRSTNNNGTCPEFDGCGPLKCAVIKDEETGCQKCACSLLPEDDEEEGKLPVGSVSGTPSEDEDEKKKSGKPEDVCGLPEVRGDCRAMVTRYRYDAKSKKCIMFHFGGCNSNGNNFVSEEKCMEFCKGQ